MKLRQILSTVIGSKAGLDSLGNWVLNRRDGSQIVLDANATTGVPSVYTQTAAGVAAQYDILTSAQAAALAAMVAGARLNVIALGDSITGRNYQIGTGDSLQAQWNSNGYLTWAQVFSTSRINVLGIAGHNGAAVTAAINSQLPLAQYIPTEVAPFSANLDAVIFLGGINDITTVIVTDAALIAGLRAIYAALRLLAKRVIACTITPLNSMTNAQLAQLTRINDFIRAECRLYPTMYGCDFAQATMDPQNGQNISGITTDGQHPAPRGASRMGQYLASIFNLWPSATDTDMSGNPFDTLSISANPLAQGANASGTNGWNATGTATGTGPATWTGNGLGTSTIAFTGGQAYPASYQRQGTGLGFDFTAVAANDSFRVFPAQLNSPVGDVFIARTWSAAGARTFGAINIPTAGNNGYLYKCITYPGGTTAGAEPTWPTTVGQTVVDNGVTWLCIENISAGDILQFEVDFYLTASTLRLLPNCDVGFLDAAQSSSLRPSTMNLGIANVCFQNVVQAPQYTAGQAQIDAATPQVLPLNQVLRITSPMMVVPALCTHIQPCFRLYGEAGATAAGQVLRAELKKVRTW